ncbi:MAG TPA: right-handed parallel beta-helix repeat-containing protein [Anaerolineae bacterium]
MFARKIPRFILIAFLLLAIQAMPPALAQPQAGTYLVTDSGNAADVDPGDGLCLTAAATCTLRAAIQEANADGVASLIHFTAPMDISFPSLPALTEGGTTIDASDRWQGTWPYGEPGVSIGGDDPVLTIQADGNVVRGLEFGGGDVMIRIESDGGANIIGGTGTGQRNVFLGQTGVQIQSSDFGNAVVGNYFGTRDGFIPIANVGNIGIFVRSDGNTIEENLIVSQMTAGIFIWNGGNNFVQNGNIIGLDAFKQTALPNAVGVLIDSGDYNVIWNNDIGGNTSHGVELHHGDHNSVVNNVIRDNGGDGIHAFDANSNQFGGDLSGNGIGGNGGNGVWLFGDDNTIQGSGIGGNGQAGVYVDHGQRNQIGGGSVTLQNHIGGNGGSGVHLATGVISTTVQGNFIGLSDGAFDAGNDGHGIYLDNGASQNRIGGLGADEGNWIAWNGLSGIFMTGSNTRDNVVEGNVIGAPINWGWEAPNGNHGIGVYNGAHHNWIGWGNTIVSSNWSGVAIVNSNDNVVWLNSIGTNSRGEAWGNSYYGVAVVNGAGNTIFGNEIAYNGIYAGQAGVRIEAGLAGNPISANSIHDNVGPGIELVNGGNFELGAPALTQASCQAQPGDQGQVQGMGCLGCTIEIFSDTDGEGRIFEGTTTADANTGIFSWQGTFNGPNVTATATTAASATSAFSTPFPVSACLVPRLFLPLITR